MKKQVFFILLLVLLLFTPIGRNVSQSLNKPLSAQSLPNVVMTDGYVQSGIHQPVHLLDGKEPYAISANDTVRVWVSFIVPAQAQNQCSDLDVIKCELVVRLNGENHKKILEMPLEYTLSNSPSHLAMAIPGMYVKPTNLTEKGEYGEFILSLRKNGVNLFEHKLQVRIW